MSVSRGPDDRVRQAERGPAPQPARILVVEDQPDVRALLVTALGLDGYRVDEAGDAHEGLKRLEEARYNLVLSDYSMPGGTGAWMLHEAARRGLLDGADAMLITAHPDVQGPENVEVLTKPVELDHFLEQVRRLLAAHDGSGRSESSMDPDRTAPPACRVELVLYVSAASAASIQARRNMERLLEQFDRTQVKFSICDLERDPLAGEADRIAFTPTLVKRFPEPRMWVLGNLRESQIVADLLRVYGVDGSE